MAPDCIISTHWYEKLFRVNLLRLPTKTWSLIFFSPQKNSFMPCRHTERPWQAEGQRERLCYSWPAGPATSLPQCFGAGGRQRAARCCRRWRNKKRNKINPSGSGRGSGSGSGSGTHTQSLIVIKRKTMVISENNNGASGLRITQRASRC